MIIDEDTIVASATAPGRGAISIIRISGRLSLDIAKLLSGTELTPRLATHKNLTFDRETIDTGLWLFFPAPHSFTGEDIIEFQGHGGPVVIHTILSIIQKLGARLAEPGEFSQRAFLNDKLDLTQAEAICDLISASSQQAVKAANNSLQGTFGQKVTELVNALINTRTHLEAYIDFPEEDICPKTMHQFEATLKHAQTLFDQTMRRAEAGSKLNTAPRAVLIGAPNSGKSSLLNAIAHEPLAIVTDIPGTTRDLINHSIIIGQYEIILTDTAGIRPTNNAIEKEGIDRALTSVETCDLIIALFDERHTTIHNSDVSALLDQHPLKPMLLVRNKLDLNTELTTTTTKYPIISISAKTGAHVPDVLAWISSHIESSDEIEFPFLARDRHMTHMQKARDFLLSASTHPCHQEFLELIAEDLRLAQKELSSITGKYTSDDLLTSIFSTFCIGK